MEIVQTGFGGHFSTSKRDHKIACEKPHIAGCSIGIFTGPSRYKVMKQVSVEAVALIGEQLKPEKRGLRVSLILSNPIPLPALN
jgi:hypothetical protein